MPEILQKPKLLSLLTHAEVSGGTKTRQISAVVCLFVWTAGDLKENALQSSSILQTLTRWGQKLCELATVNPLLVEHFYREETSL